MPTDRSIIDAESVGDLVDKTPEAARQLISNMAANSKQYGTRGDFDTTKRLMSSPKCRSVEVINNPARPGSNHREVNCINYR